MTDWRTLAGSLAGQLTADGALTGDWREAFEQVPRHVFLPGQPLADAYANDAVTVQSRPANIIGGGSIQMPTSSASQPAVVAAMLDRLDAQPGIRVLEIGTGTGYNTALLCHRLGDKNVYSIDIDPELVDTARTALASLDYHPTLVTADGHHGLPGSAPYDAIIATCSITHVPPPWISGLVDGGRIVAPLHGQGQALMVFTKTAADEVTGRFDSYPAAFMPLRDQLDNPLAPGHQLGFNGPRVPHHGTTEINPQTVADADLDLLLFLHLHLPGLQAGKAAREDQTVVNVSAPGSYADAYLEPAGPGRWPTAQRGRQRLWDTIEHAVHRWDELGKPPRNRFGITALTDPDRQYVWLDDPDRPDCWPMPL